MNVYFCSDQHVLKNIIGFIGEAVAADYLRQLGFVVQMMDNSGRSTRIGDLLLMRRWFHNNGRCRGHSQTLGIEVKTTASEKFQHCLTRRQKMVKNLRLLLIQINDFSTKGIVYSIKEVPNGWTSSKYFQRWKGEPYYYDEGAPYKHCFH